MKKILQLLSVLILCLTFTGCTTVVDPPPVGLAGHIYYSPSTTMDRIRLSDETVEQLMNNASYPDVMANGNIVAVEGVGSGNTSRLMMTDITGANRKTIVQGQDWPGSGTTYRAYFYSPRISYDQKYVAYDAGANSLTHIVDTQTGELQATIGVDIPAANDPRYYSPSWAPDGSLFVQGSVTTNNGIYKVSKDFTTITRIDPDLTNVHSPSVSPDGTTIAFMRDDELWTMGINGSNPTQLKTNLYKVRLPTWSPDSKHIAITSDGKIHIIDTKALTVTQISKGGYAGEKQICWK